MRSAREHDAALLELVVGGVDVRHPQVQHGLRGRLVVLFQKQASAAAVEEREFAVGVEVSETQLILVPIDGWLDIPDRARDLPDWTQNGRCCHGCLSATERAVVRNAAPMLQARATLDPELGHDI